MLRTVTSTLTACVLGGMIGLFAQEPAKPATSEAAKETLTGCVIEAKTTDGGKAYVLNNAQGGSASLYVLAASPASGSEASASNEDANIGKKVETNVNKKVEVTGPVQQPSPPADGASAANPKVLRPPSMQVESVKVVADTCK